MSFSSFFSEQARKPKGWFGRVVMSAVFNIGNATLNDLVFEMMAVQDHDHILEIGSGTGKLLYTMASHIEQGLIEGIDFSKAMVSLAEKRNTIHIRTGKVRIVQGDFDEIPLKTGQYDTVCSVNTLYFWRQPGMTARKIADILKPTGKLVVGVEDREQLQKRKLDDDIFHVYSLTDIQNLLSHAGFNQNITVTSRKFGSSAFHCVVAVK